MSVGLKVIGFLWKPSLLKVRAVSFLSTLPVSNFYGFSMEGFPKCEHALRLSAAIVPTSPVTQTTSALTACFYSFYSFGFGCFVLYHSGTYSNNPASANPSTSELTRICRSNQIFNKYYKFKQIQQIQTNIKQTCSHKYQICCILSSLSGQY